MKPNLTVVLAAVLTASSGAGAQTAAPPRAVQLEISRSITVPGGGWDWGEAERTIGARLSLPVSGPVSVWAGAHRMQTNRVVCADACAEIGDPWLLQAGAEYRFALANAEVLVPFVGAGASLERWSGGGGRWAPHLHAGVDLLPFGSVGVRVQASSEWQVPARLSAGVVVSLP